MNVSFLCRNGSVFAQNHYDSITLMALTGNRLLNIPFDHLYQWLPTLTSSLQIYNLSFVTARNEVWQGNVFTRVCDSVHRGDRDPLDRDPSWTETPS